MLNYLTFGIAISVISWMVGMIFNAVLVKTEYYNKISDLNFLESERSNKRIGIKYFKWIVKNTFFRFFNQKITLKDKKTTLTEIRKEMTIAEISHLIGFVFVTVFAIYKSSTHNCFFGLTIMTVNVFMNLYPSLLQQENKRRLDKLIKKQTTAANKS